MSISSMFKLYRAVKLQQKHDDAEALKLYDEAWDDGMSDIRAVLGYSILLIRDRQFDKAKEVLRKAEKIRGISEEQKSQIFVYYAVCCAKTGEPEKGIALLEKEHRHRPCTLVYQTLGYLYVDAGIADKAVSYNEEALEYDDEDPVFLDNLGQAWYRVMGDKEKAKEYFDRAIDEKATQIDTLWFLSRYDLEAGNAGAALKRLRTAAEQRFSPLNYVTKEQVDAEIARLTAE